ncbi:probable megakaryocyte-associated tyrosine-protein kinase at C-terminar half [Coccomyxa sp. Obi]|nr:probable megakaryocyte-associated tyrosine-protein kinase at C-terminar half [Coccomyxa sp. Obi]
MGGVLACNRPPVEKDCLDGTSLRSCSTQQTIIADRSSDSRASSSGRVSQVAERAAARSIDLCGPTAVVKIADCELATSPKELEDGVVEWEQPYHWHQQGPPNPPCQQERLTTVRAIIPGGYADPPHYPRLGPLLDLARKIFGTESAGVTIVDDRRMFIVEGRGILSPKARYDQDAWPSGFCCWTVTGAYPTVLTVEDSLKDVRFQQSKVVKSGLVRFYMGAPLVASNGHRVGMFCVFDNKPRKVDATSAQILSNIAELAMRELEKKWAMQLERACLDHVLRSLDCYDQGFLFVEASCADWQIIHVSPAAAQETGLPEGTHDNPLAFWDLFEFDSGMEGAMEDFRAVAERCKPFTIAGVRLAKRNANGEPSAGLWDLSFRPASKDTLSRADCAPVGIPCTLPSQLPGALATLSMFFVQVEASYEDAHEITPPSDVTTCAPKHLPFQDLELGPLICKDHRVRFYRGTHHGRNVVLKIIDKAKVAGSDEDALALTGTVTTRLRHPCIVRVLAHCVTDGLIGTKPWDSALSQQGARYDNACWMLLEYCDKGTLLDAVLQGWFLKGGVAGSPPDMMAVRTATLQIATGMAYLHGRDLIHGNLNAESVWLTSVDSHHSEDGTTRPGAFNCKVGNFALSRETILARLELDSYASISHYPPELLKDKTITKAADCYAFGMLMWEIYTSNSAWANMSHAQVVRAVLTNRKLAWPDHVPAAYRDLANSCMAYDPEDRPTMGEVVEKLHAMPTQ